MNDIVKHEDTSKGAINTQQSKTPPWFVPNKGKTQGEFPVRPGTVVQPLVNGERLFSQLADDLKAAKKSIGYVSWSIDMLMLMKRGSASNFDETYILKEILKKKAEEGVKVRLVIWKPPVGGGGGSSGGTAGADEGEQSSVKSFEKEIMGARTTAHTNNTTNWASNIDVKYVDVDMDNYYGPVEISSYHQKSVIIDIEEPSRTVGYVMGHNSLPIYWDSDSHKKDDERRNFRIKEYDGNASQDTAAFKPVESKKYTAVKQDITPRLDVSSRLLGQSVIDVYANFYRVWKDAGGKTDGMQAPQSLESKVNEYGNRVTGASPTQNGSGTATPASAPGTTPGSNGSTPQAEDAASLPTTASGAENTATPGGPAPTQITATYGDLKSKQNTVQDTRKLYLTAISRAQKYVFILNQYFRDDELLKECFTELDKVSGLKQRLVFIVVTNNFQRGLKEGAQGLEKKTFDVLKNSGYKYILAKLRTNAEPHSEVYVHAKVLIVDDVFYSIGSTNFNPRSYQNDFELNVSQQDFKTASELRKHLWRIIIGDPVDEIMRDPQEGYETWKRNIDANDPIGNTDQALTKHQFTPPEPDANPGPYGSASPQRQRAVQDWVNKGYDLEDEQATAQTKNKGKNLPHGLAVTYEPFYKATDKQIGEKKNW